MAAPNWDIDKDQSDLARLRTEHGVHISTLPCDLAVVGLALDVEDSASAALDLLRTARPYRAIGPARTAFEAAQRVIVLGTSDDYQRLGARAWLYYKQKEAALCESPTAGKDASGMSEGDRFLASSIAQMADMWGRHEPSATEFLAEAQAWLRGNKRADNFLGSSLAGPAGDAWNRAAELFGTKHLLDVENLEAVNRAVYRALSHDAHARIRLDPQAIRVDSQGYIDVIPVERDMDAVRDTVLTTLHSSMNEACIGLRYRIETRARAHADVLRAALPTMSEERRADYLPDFGTMLARKANPGGEYHFPGITIGWLRNATDGALGTGGVMTFDQRYCATFEFRGTVRAELLRRLPQDVAAKFERAMAARANEAPLGAREEIVASERADLVPPLCVNLTARLGSPDKIEGEEFIPLVVTRVW